MIQVSITLIATGFKRQEEVDGRNPQVYYTHIHISASNRDELHTISLVIEHVWL